MNLIALRRRLWLPAVIADKSVARADLQRISDRSKDAFEQREVEFQKYQDWPGIKPQPIDPLKVLDAQ